MKLDRISISKRMMLLIGLITIGFVVLAASSILMLRDQIYIEKADKTKSLVESAVSIIESYQARQAAGQMSEAEAKQAALSTLSALRYEGQNYVWVNDMTPTMVMHPMKPGLDGKPLSSVRDPNGVALFMEMVDRVRAEGAGTVEYHWPKPGAEEPVAKVSYVKGFAPWGWVVGTGIYVDDVNELITSVVLNRSVETVVLVSLLISIVYWIRNSIVHPIERTSSAMARIADGDGDLTQKLPAEGRDELADLARNFNRYTTKIEDTVCHVRTLAAQLARTAEQASLSVRDNSEAIGNQKGETQQVATAMTEMSATVQEIASSAESAASAARNADSHARDGQARVDDVKGAIASLVDGVQSTADVVTQLNANSESIGGVLDVIRGVAEQTNLLALNAAIEAARAGEQGRGFAVVADEVRTLASRTQESTSEIQTMIEHLQTGSSAAVSAIEQSRQAGTRTVDKAEEAYVSLGDIVSSVGTILDQNAQVASAAEQQAVAAQQIDRSIVAISDMAGDSADAAAHASVATADLARLGEELRDLVAVFKTRDGA